ncbi:hypothetical protein [Nonomuraea sp. NPDC001831]|uniref:hypothetical protein n=1 Tax=Nonomuraea sp. NPDC001831 TaxID=3364340 RepID=UPI0036C0D96F
MTSSSLSVWLRLLTLITWTSSRDRPARSARTRRERQPEGGAGLRQVGELTLLQRHLLLTSLGDALPTPRP